MATFPTLSVKPSYPLDPDGAVEDAILRSNSEGGYELTRPRFTRVRRNFGVSYSALSKFDTDAIRSFEGVTLRNGADSFAWTHPVTGTGYTVRLTGPVKYSYVDKGCYRVSFSICEV